MVAPRTSNPEGASAAPALKRLRPVGFGASEKGDVTANANAAFEVLKAVRESRALKAVFTDYINASMGEVPGSASEYAPKLVKDWVSLVQRSDPVYGPPLAATLAVALSKPLKTALEERDFSTMQYILQSRRIRTSPTTLAAYLFATKAPSLIRRPDPPGTARNPKAPKGNASILDFMGPMGKPKLFKEQTGTMTTSPTLPPPTSPTSPTTMSPTSTTTTASVDAAEEPVAMDVIADVDALATVGSGGASSTTTTSTVGTRASARQRARRDAGIPNPIMAIIRAIAVVDPVPGEDDESESDFGSDDE
jgi:hypothetical protein